MRLLAKLASRGASWEKGGANYGKYGSKAPNFAKGIRQESYDKKGRIGKAIQDLAEGNLKRGGRLMRQPPTPYDPKEMRKHRWLRELLMKSGKRLAKGEAVMTGDRLRDLQDPERQLKDQQKLEEHLASLTPEELKEFEKKANEKPSLFDALTSPLGFGGSR